METGHYVNSHVVGGERQNELMTQDSQSGGSKIYKLVGISFGLLCIIQFVLNVTLWQQKHGTCNGSNNVSTCNFSIMSDSDIRALILERNQLILEKGELLREKDRLNRDKNKLQRAKDQLNQENSQLLRENRQLKQGNDLLENKNRELQNTNRRVTKDVTSLKEDILAQQNHIQELQSKVDMANTQRCPPGWWRLMDSCYRQSSVPDNWQNAKQNCKMEGAHLVIVDNETEEKFVNIISTSDTWIGLKGQQDFFTNSWTWTLVDGQSLSYGYSKIQQQSYCDWHRCCAYVVPYYGCNWNLDTCNTQHYWICEKELSYTTL